ncbi:tRNA-modifying protein YgfZ [Thalassotalea euphylliae]|uniref:tRNA-modifying protein YgfZ n=1 Tax=Thalassotalea euphylliae TaxID=1655234 RepID=A0A3E0U0U7_9GAMM|nr:tRNA-modifying protein YgfZ [Thalassotalea euphylliae]REL30558.1 tRNA-modifying protein YgfZ [Thalassotalea euphylliae]
MGVLTSQNEQVIIEIGITPIEIKSWYSLVFFESAYTCISNLIFCINHQMSSALPNLSTLHPNFMMPLPQLSAIKLAGEEQQKYLQGQVTCDVNEQHVHSLQHGAHCDAKGKVLSVFRLMTHQGALLLVQPENSVKSSLAELQKFGVFAKVEISQATELTFTCLVGEDVSQQLANKIGSLPDALTPVVTHQGASIVYLAGKITRYLVVASAEEGEQLLGTIQAKQIDYRAWQLLEINEGFPQLNESTVAKYVPQMLNLDKLDGISFTKGCYLGQETVARMQYLGKNKKMMALLTGHSETTLASAIGFEKQMAENWRTGGDVLASYQADTGELYIQAVVANELSDSDVLRVKDNDSVKLVLTALPYDNTQNADE